MSAFLACFKVSTGSSYQEYSKLWDYRRLHPEFLPDTRTITLLDAGHTTTYADSLWIGLIQYIGDNTRGNRFYEFTNTLVAKITELHPYFVSPYNLSVLLAPGVDREKEDYEKNKKIAEAALSLGKKGIETTCDREKIRKIHQQEVGNDLWNKESLKNPCSDGMLPYYSASVANNLGETALAASYYKLASMNDDAPKASRFLVLLTEAKEGDRLSVAKRFLLIGVEGYDEDPYICKDTLIEILKKLDKKDSLDQEFISWLTSKESLLTPYKNQNNPLASSPTNCYES